MLISLALPSILGCVLMTLLCGFRLEGEAYVHYKAMLISLALHLILLMFELLVCDKLQTGRHLWILVFIPLIFISIVSIAVCIWAVKHDRSFEVSKSSQLFTLTFRLNILTKFYHLISSDGIKKVLAHSIPSPVFQKGQ